MGVVAMDYAKEASASIKVVRDMARGSLRLNPAQCQYLAAKLGEAGAFLESRGEALESIPGGGDDIRHKALRHLHLAVKRAELLVRSCCDGDGESAWLEAALTVAQIKEDVADILLELRWWMSMVGIACARWSSAGQDYDERELLRRAQADFQTLSGQLHARRGGELDAAAASDKGALLEQLQEYLRAAGGSASDPQQKQNYRLAVHVRAWLENPDLGALAEHPDLNSYEMVDIIGQGSFGAVMAVKWLGRDCALKALRYDCTAEATTLSAFQHPHVVQFLRFWEARHSARAASSAAAPESQATAEPSALSNIQSFILMELLPTDLALHIRSNAPRDPRASDASSARVPMTQDAAIDAMLQVAKAMHHLNERSVAHRDLKPSNVLVRPVGADEDPELASRGYVRAKLGDFGLAKTKAASVYSTQTGKVGTKIYGAPEVFDQETFEGRKFPRQADVWSFGLTFNEALTGTPPFLLPGSMPQDSLVIPNLSARIRRGLRPELPSDCPDYLKFCITQCWKLRPEDRPQFADLCTLLRFAQARSLGIVRHNHDLFSFTSKAGDVRALPPPAPPRKNLSLNFLWLLIARLPLLFSRRRSSPNVQSGSQQQSQADGSTGALKDKPLGRLVSPVASSVATADSKLDVIFFEGNVGRRKNLSCKDTWVQRGKPEVWWPRDWLSVDFKRDVRVLVLEYSISGSGIDGVVAELQTLLVSSDLWNRGHTWNRPIVLVGHSLGCVVIEQLVVALAAKARAIGSLNDEFDSSRAAVSAAFLASLAGCFFFAPPFTGLVSDASLLAEVFGGLSYSPKLFADLHSSDSEDGSKESRLKEVSARFLQELGERVKLMALVEVLNTKGRTVVPPVSMQAFEARGCRVEELPDSNHEDTCKPTKKEHPSYRHLHEFIGEILKQQVGVDMSGDRRPVSSSSYLSQ